MNLLRDENGRLFLFHGPNHGKTKDFQFYEDQTIFTSTKYRWRLPGNERYHQECRTDNHRKYKLGTAH